MRKTLLAAIALGLVVPATPAFADHHEGAQPELREVNWYHVRFIKWKRDKGDRAHEIIAMFEQADKAVGYNDVIDFHMHTGEWHSVVAIPIRDGLASIGWKARPSDKVWGDAFIQIAGGEDKAKALWAEFDSLILEERQEIGHIDVDE